MWRTPCFSYGGMSHTLIPPQKVGLALDTLTGFSSSFLQPLFHSPHINFWGEAGITLCEKEIYARGLRTMLWHWSRRWPYPLG